MLAGMLYLAHEACPAQAQASLNGLAQFLERLGWSNQANGQAWILSPALILGVTWRPFVPFASCGRKSSDRGQTLGN